MTELAEAVQRLEYADQDITDAKERYVAVLEEVRALCKHETLLEAGWQEQMFFSSLPPLRICETCGVEEEGWNFKVLTGRAYRVARHEVYRARKNEPGRALVKK